MLWGMFQEARGFAQFISIERGIMLFMISVGVTFLTAKTFAWPSALYLGSTIFCIWSAADAINNVYDVDLDLLSDPLRAEFTKKLGKNGLFITIGFIILSLSLGTATQNPNVILFIVLGIIFGILYSVPPFRLRKTKYKPIVNFTVGAIPILVIAAFYNAFSSNTISLVLLIGVTTTINSLWEDLADYASDFNSGSKTIPIIFGFRTGLFITISLGYFMIPLMVFVGLLFQLNWVYYASLLGLATFISLRLIQKRGTLFQNDGRNAEKLHRLGEVLAKDFIIVAIIFTLSLMVSSIVKFAPVSL